MTYLSRLFLWLCLAFTVSNQQSLPFGGYQHDIVFPSITGKLHTLTTDSQQPIRQVSTGFYLNPPPPLPFLQSFPISPFLFPRAENEWRNGNSQRGRFLPPPLFNLFTPNTVRNQRPESEAQDEAYRKSLIEEAEATEQEKIVNDLTTDFDSLEATSIGPNSKTFVRLNVHGKDYSYST